MLREKRNKTSKQIQELQQSAQRFCFLVENINGYGPSGWLMEISQLLPRIHSGIGLLDNPTQAECLFSLADIDERFELFCYLKKFLGKKDGYEVGEELSNNELYGSLAEDLVDLYFEIKRGLDLLYADKANLGAALSLWRDGFFLRWGKHLIDAERHLYDLRVHRQI